MLAESGGPAGERGGTMTTGTGQTSAVPPGVLSPMGEAAAFVCLAALFLGGLTVGGRVPAVAGSALAIGVLALGVLGFVLPADRLPPWVGLTYVASTFVPTGIALTVLGEAPQTFALFAFAPFPWVGVHGTRQSVFQLLPIALLCTLVPTAVVDRTVTGVITMSVTVAAGVWVGALLAATLERQRTALAQTLATERTRTAMMRAFAHDIGQPLTVIAGNLALLERHEELDEAHRRRLTVAAGRHARRLTALASTLLDMDRVQHGQLVLDRERVDVDDLITRAARVVDVEVERVVDADASTVDVDPARLEQVLVNLLSNAARHGRPPVVVTVAAVDSNVEIRVRDHGPGIAPSMADDAFEPFTTANGSDGGRGVGLSIVRALVDAHGGSVTASTVDPGLEVVIILPT